ncbi:MAG: MFS transporter [Candidatus Hodarchaeales archaeon]|jgi:MFS family permease
MSESAISDESETKSVSSSRFKLLLGVLVVLFFIASAYGVQRTILSTYAGEDIDVSTWFETGAWVSIAFTLAGFGLFKALAGLFSGPLTEKIGVRSLIISGAISFSIGSLILVFSSGAPLIIGFGNSFLGAGEGLIYAGAMTYLTNACEVSKRAQWLGVMELAVYSGYSFGAFASGIITVTTESLQLSFIFSLIISLLGLGLSILVIKSLVLSESSVELQKLRTQVESTTSMKPLQVILTRPTVILTFLSGHVSKMVDSIIVLYLPLVLSHETFGYSVPIEATGLIIASFTLTWAISMPIAGRISDSIGRKTPITIGLFLEALAILGLSSGASPIPILFLLSALGGVGVGLYYPILPSIAVDIVDDQQKSYIIGFFRAFKDLGYFTGPLLAGIVATLWYDVNSDLQVILHVPLNFASLLLILAGLGLLFLVRETRPGWRQFQSTLEHAQLVEDSVIQSTKGILTYLEQETIENTEFQKKLARYTLHAKELEVEADSKLEQIVIQSYHAVHKSPDAGNFLRIARRLDRVAGLTLGALYRLQRIPLESIPPLVQEKLHDASITLRSLVRTTIDILQVLDIKLDAVSSVYTMIRDRETDLDLLYQLMNRQMFLSADFMKFGTWYEIKEVINMIEEAADSSEDAAEVINILSIKYKT